MRVAGFGRAVCVCQCVCVYGELAYLVSVCVIAVY